MFRVLSYNVNGLRGGVDRVAAVMDACDVDVACVQESPRLWRWRSRCAELAGRSGMRMVAGGYPAGLLMLAGSRVRVRHTDARWLSLRPRYLQRGLTLAVIEVGQARVTVANMHLDLDAAGRRRHLSEILNRVEAARVAYDAPVVLLGDVNETPEEPVWQVLTRRLVDAYSVAPRGGEMTFPAAQPRRRIDGVFVDETLDVHGCGVPPEVADIGTASDHRPVLADLSSRQRGGLAERH